jgi:hypothetical protein
MDDAWVIERFDYFFRVVGRVVVGHDNFIRWFSLEHRTAE